MTWFEPQKQLCHKNCPSYKVLYCKPNISFWKIDDLGFSVRIKYLKILVKYNNHQLLHQKGFFFKKKWANPGLYFMFIFVFFQMIQFKYKLIIA